MVPVSTVREILSYIFPLSLLKWALEDTPSLGDVGLFIAHFLLMLIWFHMDYSKT